MTRLDVWIEDERLTLHWASQDHWAAILESFKVMFTPMRERRYNPPTRSWSLPRSCEQRLRSWADHWFARDAQVWDLPEPKRAGGKQKKTRPQPTATLADAYTVLHLMPTAPDELVSAAVRILAKHHHPDHGGDGALMTRINLAAERIRSARVAS